MLRGAFAFALVGARCARAWEPEGGSISVFAVGGWCVGPGVALDSCQGWKEGREEVRT